MVELGICILEMDTLVDISFWAPVEEEEEGDTLGLVEDSSVGDILVCNSLGKVVVVVGILVAEGSLEQDTLVYILSEVVVVVEDK